MQLRLRGLRQRLGLDHQLAYHRPPPGFQRPLRFIPLHRVGTLRQLGTGGDQLADIHWQSQQHAGIRRGAALQQQRSDQPLMAAQRVVGVQHRAHAVRQLVAPLLTAASGDAIGEGRRQQPRHSFGIGLAAAAGQTLHQLLRPLLPVGLLTGKDGAQIHQPAARRLLKDRRQPGRRRRLVIGLRGGQHRRQPGLVAEGRHFAAKRRQPLAVQRRERLQQAARGGQVHRGRLIQPGQRGRIVAAPLQQLQQ